MPTNKRGYTVPQTFEEAQGAGGQFSQDEANYRQPATEQTCGTCRFYLRDKKNETGKCQVVSGDIAWFGTCDLYISAEDEARVSLGDNPGYGYSDEESKMDEQKEETTQPEQTEEGEDEKDMTIMIEPAIGPTSWDELDAKQDALEQAANIQQVTSQFQMMVHNVLQSDTDDKGAAIEALSSGLSARLRETKELEIKADERLTKERHYKDVAHDSGRAVESDFQGGCQACRFGEPDILKELANCPYCWNELEASNV